MTMKLTKEIYQGFRDEGMRVIDIKPKLDEINREHESKPLILGLIEVAIGMIMFCCMFDLTTFWVTSPSGKIHKELPLQQALRIMRKHNWTAAEVEPVRMVSRFEAFKIMIFGDKPFEERRVSS